MALVAWSFAFGETSLTVAGVLNDRAASVMTRCDQMPAAWPGGTNERFRN